MARQRDFIEEGRNSQISLLCRWLILTLFVYFFHGYIVEYLFKSVHQVQNLLEELMVVVLLLLALTTKRIHFIRLPGLFFLIGYIVLGLISSIINDVSYVKTFISNRYAINVLIFITITVCARFSRHEINLIFKYMMILFLIQLFAALANVLMHGRTERFVGTITNSGGGAGTVFPLLALSYFMGYYLYKSRNWMLFLLTFSFILVGVANGKRAICVLFPIFFCVGLFLDSFFCRSINKFIRTIITIALIAPVLLVVGLFLLGNSGGFRHIKEEQTLGKQVQMSYNYGIKYSTEIGDSETIVHSRGGCFRLMIKYLLHGYEGYWLGIGPILTSTESEKQGFEEYGFGYGVSGWITDAIRYGTPAMFFHFFFFITMLITLLRKISFHSLNESGKVLYFGTTLSLICFLFIHLIYNSFLCQDSIMQFPIVFSYIALLDPFYRPYFYREYEVYA